MVIICLIIVVIACGSDAVKNAECDAHSRNYSAQRGYKYYISSSGRRYTSTGSKVYK